MSDSGAELALSTRKSRHIFDIISRRWERIRQSWASSIGVRTISLILLGSILGFGATGAVIVAQVKSAVFDQTVESSIEQFANDVVVVQERFLTSRTPTSGQAQREANELVRTFYDPARGILGAVLIRTPNQEPSPTQIIEPRTASTTKVRSLLTEDIRRAVVGNDDIVWKSVSIPAADTKIPGILIGTNLTIPGSGEYELYTVYSVEQQQSILAATFRVLAFALLAAVILLTGVSYLVMSLVLKPIREASESAQQLADGEFDSRMTVRGADELAQLALSFNQMASSLEEQFGRLQRMSKVQTDFVSAVSHELRSPVTTIRMAGQLIYDKREDLPPGLKRSAELQHSQLINLDTMLSDLLEISRYDAGGMALVAEPVNVSELVKKVIDMAEPLALDNGVVVAYETDGDTDAVVERRRVERIVRNLVVNALEHAEGKPVHVNVKGGGDAVAVEVRDHGVGLTPEHAAHVFDRFWRADSSRVRKTGGTGLGLTIAREDARIHGGTLEATGALGVGSTFLLTLPIEPGEPFTPPIKLAAPEPEELPELEAPKDVVPQPSDDEREAIVPTELEPAQVAEASAPAKPGASTKETGAQLPETEESGEE